MDEKGIEYLTLLLIYLTSWDENPERKYGDKPILRARGYDFTALDSLREKGLIRFSEKAKSVYLTEKGVEREGYPKFHPGGTELLLKSVQRV